MRENEQPIVLFKKWFREEMALTKVRIPTAVCLSTNGIDDYPNARFVSLKEIIDEAFIITGPVKSQKGKEIEKNKKVALTFWWTETERQVRIQGKAAYISDKLADKYFQERSRESQLLSILSDQGEVLKSRHDLEKKFEAFEANFEGKVLKRPKEWGGFYITPYRIELFEFKESRFHERRLFTKKKGEWEFKELQA
ncbi:MAG: pyridoxal 5'-phosphate synthase [Cytophagales bacterium]